MQRELDTGALRVDLETGFLGADLLPARPRWAEGAPSRSVPRGRSLSASSIGELVTRVVNRVSAGHFWVASGKIPWWGSRRSLDAGLAGQWGDFAGDAEAGELSVHRCGLRYVLTAAQPFDPPAGAELRDVRDVPLQIANYWVTARFELDRWRVRASLDPVAANRLGIGCSNLTRYVRITS